MNKTRIEWCDYTINPVKGLCPMACSYCYARAMYKRFKWNPEIRFDIASLRRFEVKKPSRIFVGSTIELFHEGILDSWLEIIFEWVRLYPQHTFIFLTKQPQNLIKWSPFPDNCWVGVSASNAKMAEEAGFWLWEAKAKIKFVSFEPLLEQIPVHFADYISEEVEGIKWVIIGQQTPPSRNTSPQIEWVKDIVKACDKAHIPVFLKDNLMNCFFYAQQSIRLPDWARNKDIGGLRQEFPK